MFFYLGCYLGVYLCFLAVFGYSCFDSCRPLLFFCNYVGLEIKKATLEKQKWLDIIFVCDVYQSPAEELAGVLELFEL